jgi:hypothetical protein
MKQMTNTTQDVNRFSLVIIIIDYTKFQAFPRPEKLDLG